MRLKSNIRIIATTAVLIGAGVGGSRRISRRRESARAHVA